MQWKVPSLESTKKPQHGYVEGVSNMGYTYWFLAIVGSNQDSLSTHNSSMGLVFVHT